MIDPDIDLRIGGIYEVKSRNLVWAVWDGYRWIGLRNKFGWRLDASEVTVRPLRFIEMLPTGISFDMYFQVERDGRIYVQDNPEMFNHLMGVMDREVETKAGL